MTAPKTLPCELRASEIAIIETTYTQAMMISQYISSSEKAFYNLKNKQACIATGFPRRHVNATFDLPAGALRQGASVPFLRPPAADILETAWKEALKSISSLSLPPSALTEIQAQYIAQATALWNETLQRLKSPTRQADGVAPTTPVIADRRFSAKDWVENPMAAFVAQFYLLNARTLISLAELLQGDAKAKQRIRFAVQQWVDATAPSNYLALNPEALRLAVETKGESLAQGLRQLMHDLRRGHVSQTDESQFEVGRNVATSEGAVVYETELFQLIEYKPLTSKVFERPLLFVPPCINKYYILDLQPENSLIRFAVEQGHRVFVISWRNANEALAKLSWDDYVEGAIIRAIEVVKSISAQPGINALGFCVGGTLLATALAVLAGRGESPVAHMSLLTTFLDFSDTGILDVFVDEAAVAVREATIGHLNPKGGLLKGQELSSTFSFLRPNDLVWNYVVGNYLKGQTPPPFDLLYWNNDSTNLPGPMYCWYLRNTYLENNLIKPGKLKICGQTIDFQQIKADVYIYASREDHIVPWESAYRTVHLLPGKKRFVLGASGHIAGVINPPVKKKRSHWVGTTHALPAQAQAWLEKSVEHPGSWWTDWAQWLAGRAGKSVTAPKSYGSKQYQVIEPAPGRYVKERV
jgi:polyhydroxyalkanoate synthase